MSNVQFVEKEMKERNCKDVIDNLEEMLSENVKFLSSYYLNSYL